MAHDNLLDTMTRQFESVYHNHPDAVCVIDVNGRYRYCNPASARIFGYSPEDLIGRPVGVYTLEADRDSLRQHLQNALLGTPQQTDVTICTKSGQPVHLHVTLAPETLDGKVVAIHGFCKDISDLLRTQQELEKTITERKKVEVDLAQAQAIAQVGNYTWNLLTNQIYCSDEARRIFGMTENVSNVGAIVSVFHPDDREKLDNVIYRALNENNAVHDVECRLLRPDGTERFVHLHGSATINESGQPVTLFGTVQDITDRKLTEEVIHRSDKLAVVGELAAGVAHEIRNPLTTLKGFLQLMNSSDYISPQRQKQYCEVMLSELRHIDIITSELLLLAKPQAFALGNRSLTTKLLEVVSLLEPQALLHNVEITLDIQHEDIQVNTETGRIKQVFVNVIKNAIEAMPQGGRLNIKVVRANQQEALIQFSDTGCGIPRERIPRLGEPFYTTKEKGTGLGLMVINKIVQDHKGKIEFKSALGKGTTVTITLPVA